MRLVSVVTSTRSPRNALRLHLAKQVINLRSCRPHLNHGINQAGRPHQLLDHLAGMLGSRNPPVSPKRTRSAASGASNSSNFSGRLSSAEGSRKP